jgi:hypothetical protein
MADPLSVSQLLPGDRPYFDVVIFDEASQVLPEDAVTSLLRGARAVIAGDARQLPPTTFFAAGVGDEGDEESGEATGGFESVLDVMSAFLDPPWSLDWHYRSRDEALIAFSNHHIYGNRLVTFPGPGQGAVSWVHVAHVPGEAGRDDSAAREVQRVVDLILDHARHRPDESLGVIAMGITQPTASRWPRSRARYGPRRVLLGRARRPVLRQEPRSVRATKRDAIILSVKCARTRQTPQLPLRAAAHAGRRTPAQVAIRARRRITLVSSFSHAACATEGGVTAARVHQCGVGAGRASTADDHQVPLNDFDGRSATALDAPRLARDSAARRIALPHRPRGHASSGRAIPARGRMRWRQLPFDADRASATSSASSTSGARLALPPHLVDRLVPAAR